jgi:hypothetical protein
MYLKTSYNDIETRGENVPWNLVITFDFVPDLKSSYTGCFRWNSNILGGGIMDYSE